MRFCRMQWSPTRFYGSLSVYSRPPLQKTKPLCSPVKNRLSAILVYYILIACVQTSPLPQEKSGEETSIYSVLNTEPVIKANKLYKTMQIVELGEAIKAYDIMNIMEWCPLKSVSCKIAGPMTICVKDAKDNFLEDYCLYLLFLYL